MNIARETEAAGFTWVGDNCYEKRIRVNQSLFVNRVSGGFTVTFVNFTKLESYTPTFRRDNSAPAWPLAKCLKWARRVERLKSSAS